MTIRQWGNPYTHEEHSRECLPNKPHHKSKFGFWLTRGNDVILECDWCGQKPARLYRYDGDKHVFCNRQCYKDYHS